MILFRVVWRSAPGLVALLLCSATAQAADSAYPDRPVRMMVPFPPGGANDIVARLVAQKLSARWGKAVVIDNRAGAGGNIGTEIGAKAAPDGYTLTIGSTSTYCTNVVLEPRLSFDPRRDFAPIALIVTAPNVLVVHPSLPIATVAEFIKYAKTNPARLNFSSFGDGSSAHLVFRSLRGTHAGVGGQHQARG